MKDVTCQETDEACSSEMEEIFHMFEIRHNMSFHRTEINNTHSTYTSIECSSSIVHIPRFLQQILF